MPYLELMNVAHFTTAQNDNINAGDLVFVLPGYSSETKARTSIDAWTETHMLVVKVYANGDCLLDYDEDGEGEVYINKSRLVLIPA